MAQNQADSNTLEGKIDAIQAVVEKIRKENKGLKGQIGLIRNKVGLPRPGEIEEKPESSPNESKEAENKPQQAPPEHDLPPYMRYCPECGGEQNPKYANEVECSKEKGGCGVNLGSLEYAKHLTRCYNCGRSDTAKEVKKVVA